MKKRLLELLICPACLPSERPLGASVSRTDGEDILAGDLTCKSCSTRYPVKDGVGVLLRAPAETERKPHDRYETEPLVSAYLWSQYGDLFGEPEAAKAYRTWASLAGRDRALSLDAGCAVGRFTFELSARSEFTVGLDRSTAFVRTARRLMQEGHLTFSLITEGLLTESRSIALPEAWRADRTEFIMADALALPFPREVFSFLGSLNLIDKVSKPLQHLREINRVARGKDSLLLFTDPFSWSTESAAVEDWLGGKNEGPYAGPGIANVRRLLEGEGGVLEPAWRIREQGSVSWTIRNHRNHRELIRSEYLLAAR
ncbi:MAG: methyltransferase domain-containing protein [Thermodesulfobacteriota bacterium]